MKVRDHPITGIIILNPYPFFERAEIITEMEFARRPHAGEHDFFGFHIIHSIAGALTGQRPVGRVVADFDLQRRALWNGPVLLWDWRLFWG